MFFWNNFLISTGKKKNSILKTKRAIIIRSPKITFEALQQESFEIFKTPNVR